MQLVEEVLRSQQGENKQVWKNNTAPGAMGLFLPGNESHRTNMTPPPPQPNEQRQKGKGNLTFHRILLSSHDVNQGALQGVHVQAIVHSGAVLKNTRKGNFLSASAQHDTNSQPFWVESNKATAIKLIMEEI